MLSDGVAAPSRRLGHDTGLLALAPLLESSSDGWFATDTCGRIGYANSEFRRLVDVARPIGTDFCQLVVPEARAGMRRSFRRVGSGDIGEYRSIVPVGVDGEPEALTLALQRFGRTCEAPSIAGVLARPNVRRPDRVGTNGDRQATIDRALARITGLVLAALDGDEQHASNGAQRAPLVFDELSPRQHEVLNLVLDGSSHAEIGRRLYISLHTVRNHLSTIYRQLGVHSELELIAFCRARQNHPTAWQG